MNFFRAILLVTASANAFSQGIILDKGFENLTLGIGESQVEDIVGFQGKPLNREEYFSTETQGRDVRQLPENQKGFDKCIIYKHIMPIPVTKVFLKKGKVNMIEVNSYPDFTRPICLDVSTKEGLKFWDSVKAMEKIYGTGYRKDSNDQNGMQYFYYDSKGIGFAASNNEIRIIYIY